MTRAPVMTPTPDEAVNLDAAVERLREIISDEEIVRVHGHANFGTLSPREVVNDGVRKYAVGYQGGYTQLCILMEHGLITKPRPGRYDACLTKKGRRYFRVLYDMDRDALSASNARASEWEAKHKNCEACLTAAISSGKEQHARAEAAEEALRDVREALDCALLILEPLEPGDSRAVSNEFVAMAAAGTPHHNDEGREIIRAFIARTTLATMGEKTDD